MDIPSVKFSNGQAIPAVGEVHASVRFELNFGVHLDLVKVAGHVTVDSGDCALKSKFCLRNP